MRPKNLLRVIGSLVLFIAVFAVNAQALARGNAEDPVPPEIVYRTTTYWDAVFVGNVDATRYERWSLPFDQPYTFTITVTVTGTTGDLVPVVLLLNGAGAELARGTYTLTSTQPAGSYFVQVQPESGSGSYNMTVRQVDIPTPTPTEPVPTEPSPTEPSPTEPVPTEPSPTEPVPTEPSPTEPVPTEPSPTEPVPTEPSPTEPSPTEPVPTEPSPTEPVPTETPPAGPNVSAVVDASGVKVGETATATVSLGNVPSTGYASTEFTCTYDPAILEVSNILEAGLFGADAVVAVNGPANGSFVVAIAGSNGKEATTNGAALTFKLKGLAVGQSAIQCQARVSSGDGTLTSIAATGDTLPVTAAQGTMAGKVLAKKPVTITLYAADSSVVGTTTVNTDGTFTMAADAGTYTVKATAPGFLSAQGSAVITGGGTLTKPNISLLAGDIDGNNVIDAFDAMTIGINYNLSVPAVADLNNDGTINVLDLELLAANYHQSGALAWE